MKGGVYRKKAKETKSEIWFVKLNYGVDLWQYKNLLTR
jgi:hypothetical protein